jgi:hypothetical protein
MGKKRKRFYLYNPIYMIVIFLLFIISDSLRLWITGWSPTYFMILLPLMVIPIAFLAQVTFIINPEGVRVLTGSLRINSAYSRNFFISAADLLGVCLIDPEHNPIYALFYKASSGKIGILRLPFRHNICIHFKLAIDAFFPELAVYHGCASLTTAVLGRLVGIIKPRFAKKRLILWTLIFSFLSIAGIVLLVFGLVALVSLLEQKPFADYLKVFSDYFDQQLWIYIPVLLAIFFANLMFLHPRIVIVVYQNGIGISKGGFPGFTRWDRIESIDRLKTIPRLIIKYRNQSDLTRRIRIMGYFLEHEINELKEKVLSNG